VQQAASETEPAPGSSSSPAAAVAAVFESAVFEAAVFEAACVQQSGRPAESGTQQLEVQQSALRGCGSLAVVEACAPTIQTLPSSAPVNSTRVNREIIAWILDV